MRGNGHPERVAAEPIAGAYWVEPDRLMIGPYPSGFRASEARADLEQLIDCGIRSFMNLMHEEPRGLVSYEPIVREIARERAERYSLYRFGIEDCSVPEPDQMDEILDVIDRSLARGEPMYVHCWGGRGRAGIVAAVALIRSGRASQEDVRQVIAALRGRDPLARPSPETDEQLEFVCRYTAAMRERARTAPPGH